MATTAQQIQVLRDKLEIARTRRTEAEVAQRSAQTTVGKINDAIKDLGFNPETIEQDVEKLEAALDLRVTEALTAVDAEIAQLDAVVTAAKSAGVL